MTYVCFLIASHLSLAKRSETLKRAVKSCQDQHLPDGVEIDVYTSVSVNKDIKTMIICPPLNTKTTFMRANHQCAQFVHLTMLTAILLLKDKKPDWIVLLDDDDWLELTYLEKMLELEGNLRHCSGDMCHDPDGHTYKKYYANGQNADHSGSMMTFDVFCRAIYDVQYSDVTLGIADCMFRTFIKESMTIHPDILIHRYVNHTDKVWKTQTSAFVAESNIIFRIDNKHEPANNTTEFTDNNSSCLKQ